MPSSVSSSTAELLAAAASVVSQVVHRGRALDEALQRREGDRAVPRPALQALSFGTLRWYPRIALWIDALATRPATMQPEVRAVLAVALHQLNFSHHPEHAIVNAAVDAIKSVGHPRAAGFANALLRAFLRNKDALRERVMQDESGRFAHPQWLIDRVRAEWPGQWPAILDANNASPPMWLRVNRLQGTTADYLSLLAEHGFKGSSSETAPDAVLLAEPVDVGQLPGFAEGRVSVQDAGAQLAADLLEAQAGMRVLDACAAPGGKACHVLERTPDLAELVMVERSASRMEQIAGNLTRLRLDARGGPVSAGLRTVVGDAGRPQDWWTGDPRPQPFDRILLDVPCSATGVIRRHPDIKILRRPTDIARLAAEQLRLLRSLWPLLRSGGRLLYVSCSILAAENGGTIRGFLEQEPTAREIDLTSRFPSGVRPKDSPGRQVLPPELDGFYYACLEKSDI